MNRPPRWAAGRDGISHAHPSARATACGVPAIAEALRMAGAPALLGLPGRHASLLSSYVKGD